MLIDLSHTIEAGMITYKGLPAPIICDFLSREESRGLYAPDTEFHIGRIDMVANTGTYVDSPFHRYADGRDLADLQLERLADVDALLVDVTGSTSRAIGRRHFDGLRVSGRAVLVRTGWDRNWRTNAYFTGHPYLTEDAARYLVDEGAAIVGIDSYNIDDTDDLRRPVHSTLLGADIPIVEHMTRLDAIPDGPFRFFAVPVKVRAMGTFPVRAFVIR